MANSNEEQEETASDVLMSVAVKWFCAQYQANGIVKKRMDNELIDAIVLAMSERMVRARTTGERLPWEEELWRAASVSAKMRERVGETLRTHRRPGQLPCRGDDGSGAKV